MGYQEHFKIRGHLEVWKLHKGLWSMRELILDKHQTIGTSLHTNLRTVLMSRSVEYGVDAIAWGSFKVAGGTFIDSDYAGTTSTGTKGSLIQSSVGTNQVKFSGTFSFSTTKQVNFWQIGRGYTAAAAGVSALFTTIYAYDNSLLTGSSYVPYDNGDSQIVNWTLQLGS